MKIGDLVCDHTTLTLPILKAITIQHFPPANLVEIANIIAMSH